VDLSGCAALVTGGSGDLGRAIALTLAEAGADVAVTWVGYREARSRRAVRSKNADGERP